LALGCWAFAGGAVWGNQEETDSINTIRAALDAGINFFDTAERYGDGRSEEVLGRALKASRHQAVIASKVYSDRLSRAGVVAACEESLKRLQTDYIDLYQIHWSNHATPVEETAAALEQLICQGKIRAAGVCNFGVRDLAGITPLVGIATDQLPYSLLWRAIEQEILPACRQHQVGVIAYSPLCQGLLTGKYKTVDEVPPRLTGIRLYSQQRSNIARHGEAGLEAETFTALDRIREICAGTGETMGTIAISWVLRQAGITSALVGARTPEQLRQNLRAAEIAIPADIANELTAATAELKAKVADNPDMWEGKAKSRYC
jgi:aryl-alcohol dehydrogenase-like predicted oxidoreductase